MIGAPCGCDEAQLLRTEVARLQGVIAGMKMGLAWTGSHQPPPPSTRCEAYHGCLLCELPGNHDGAHRCGQVVF